MIPEYQRLKRPTRDYAIPERFAYPCYDMATAASTRMQADADLDAKAISRGQHARIVGAVNRALRRFHRTKPQPAVVTTADALEPAAGPSCSKCGKQFKDGRGLHSHMRACQA